MDTAAVAMTPGSCRAAMVSVADRLVPPSSPGKQHVHGLDRLARAAELRRPDELTQQLPPEQPVILEPLVPPRKAHRRGLITTRRKHAQIKAGEQIGPQVCHNPTLE
jgi:hypothetical protein